MSRRTSWEKASIGFKNMYSSVQGIAPSLLVSDGQHRWENLELGLIKILPVNKDTWSMMFGHEIISKSPFTNQILAVPQIQDWTWNKYVSLVTGGVNVGSVLSSFLSFSLDNFIINYDEWAPAVDFKDDLLKPTAMGSQWAGSWNFILDLESRIDERSKYRLISKEEEERKFKHTMALYNKIVKLEDDIYNKIIRSMRLFQYALFASRLDLSISYSLLVASVDAVSRNNKVKRTIKNIDPDRTLRKVMDKLQLDEKTINQVENVFTYGSNTEQFTNFILDNLSDNFWEYFDPLAIEDRIFYDDYRMTGEYYKELSDHIPIPSLKKKLEEVSNGQKSRSARMRKRREEYKKSIEEKELPWLLDYSMQFTNRILNNTFGARSRMLHMGLSFPSYSLDTSSFRLFPMLFDVDRSPFLDDFLDLARAKYELHENGKIKRIDGAGKKKEILPILNITIFKKMVIDSISNYILKY